MPGIDAKLLRKRKTKRPCPVCFLHLSRCICAEIPSLNLRTKVSLIVHAKELKRTTNTGRLALKALVNSQMIVRGADKTPLDLTPLLAGFSNLLFFPAQDAVELTADFLLQFDKPIQLLVPDGNWRQAGKVSSRHPELDGIPRVKIGAPNRASLHLRRETSIEGMSTLEAIARALRVIEGEDVYESLNRLYQAKLNATLKGRPTAKT